MSSDTDKPNNISIGSGDYAKGAIHKSRGIHEGMYSAPAVGNVENGEVQLSQDTYKIFNINITPSTSLDEELLQILESEPSKFEEILKIYDEYLDTRGWTGNRDNDLRKILTSLIREIPISDKEKSEPIIEFLRRLVASGKLSPPVNSQLSNKYTFSEPQNELKNYEAQPYLLIRVIPCLNEEFFVKAWLICDDKLTKHEERFRSILSDKENHKYSFRELEHNNGIIKEIIDESLTILGSYPISNNLIIEFFLPSKQIDTNVHLWEFLDDYNYYLKIGREYPVVVRCNDRLEPRYQKKMPKWISKWDNLNKLLPNQIINAFVTFGKTDDLKELRERLAVDTIVGLKHVCYSCRKPIDLIDALLSSAAPIAIWSSCDAEDEINSLLNGSSVNLPDYLHKKRQDNWDIGQNLVILWEDPHRLTPDVGYNFEYPASST